MTTEEYEASVRAAQQAMADMVEREREVQRENTLQVRHAVDYYYVMIIIVVIVFIIIIINIRCAKFPVNTMQIRPAPPKD